MHMGLSELGRLIPNTWFLQIKIDIFGLRDYMSIFSNLLYIWPLHLSLVGRFLLTLPMCYGSMKYSEILEGYNVCGDTNRRQAV
jgi:hypothetical protein